MRASELAPAACAVALLVNAGCGGARATAPPLDPAAFLSAKTRLEALRADASRERTQKLQLELDAPYLPSKVTARGAMALSPPDRLRMILLGPGGTTAMDLWLSGARFRFAIPAIDRVVRGDERTPERQRRGLPVDFLRWWTLDALSGELVAARAHDGDLEVLLREPARVTEATLKRDGSISAHRTWFGEVDAEGRTPQIEEEWVEAGPNKDGAGCRDAVYRQRSTRLVVSARCESERDGVSAPALVDPDAPRPEEAAP